VPSFSGELDLCPGSKHHRTWFMLLIELDIDFSGSQLLQQIIADLRRRNIDMAVARLARADRPARSGALQKVSTSPLAESFPYISVDKTGQYLFGASYGGNVISLNAIGPDGRVTAEPLQVIPVGRNAHSIRTDGSNRFAYVATLGTDQIFQFNFDAKTGRLSSATPPVLQMKPSFGPRHFVLSKDNRFMYVLSELQGTVATLALDGNTGQLSEVSSVSGMPPVSKLVPGMPRGAVGTPTANQAPRNTDNDIWAADIHMTPDERFLYISERTSNSLAALSVHGTNGKLTYLGSTPIEKAAARLRHRSHRTFSGRVRREIGDDFGVLD